MVRSVHLSQILFSVENIMSIPFSSNNFRAIDPAKSVQLDFILDIWPAWLIQLLSFSFCVRFDSSFMMSSPSELTALRGYGTLNLGRWKWFQEEQGRK